ncbi:MAG: N-acetylmuramoyl-L-alanine amidase [Bacilli bacterium]|nr:N-acetylmuramoyl-L-alanine amidase [Bacilli bacterium]MDD4282477.1 N-acetylmuramoyl-L-alanine amidase [Bacilli bacterium]MDD4719050.1 N-acetylmuramoyl-L-alanine amidase [Bacilli bacterium]
MISKILNFKSNDKKEINKFQQEIINSKSARYIFMFAKYIDGANIDLLSKELIDLNDKRYIHFFVRSIKGLNYDLFMDKILTFKDPGLLYYIVYDTADLPGEYIIKIACELYDLKNDNYFYKFMYNYFVIRKEKNNEIFSLLKKYLVTKNINIVGLTLSNVKNFMLETKTKFDEKYDISSYHYFSNNCNIGRKNIVPDMIVYHITSNYEKAISMFYDSKTEVSSHFIVSENGESKQIIDLKDSAWANGTSLSEDSDMYFKFAENSIVKSRFENANHYTFSIENESYDGDLTEKQYLELLKITKKIIRFMKTEYNVDFIIDREHIVGHNEINPIVRNVCPGQKFPFKRLIKDLKSIDWN